MRSEQAPNRVYPNTGRNASGERLGILDRIVTEKRREIAVLRTCAADLRARAADAPPVRSLTAALRSPERVRLLAEVKRRSPSAGAIRAGADPAGVAAAYRSGGAAAVSVLTDREFFGGSLEDLRAVRAAVSLPVLRKDFVVDPLQLWEARGAGADGALLIVRILPDSALRELLALTAELGMDALVEAHDEAELERALAAGARLVGINHRDLATFRVDLGLAERVAPGLPDNITLVAESGIRTAADVQRLGAAGVHAVLVGEALMREDDPAGAAAALAAVARRPRSGS